MSLDLGVHFRRLFVEWEREPCRDWSRDSVEQRDWREKRKRVKMREKIRIEKEGVERSEMLTVAAPIGH